MDAPTLDPVYLEQLKPTFEQLFIQFIKPVNVVRVFHKYNKDILTGIDLDNITAKTTSYGPIEGSILLFERLVLYKGWYPCLLKVLCDREVCLSHVAQEMEEIKGVLDDEILQEESDDQSENKEKWLTGLSLFTSGLTRVLHVPPNTTNLNNLKVDPVLEKRLLKKKVELERLQKELDEVKQCLRELNQSYNELRQETNLVLSSDVDITEKQHEQCKDCKEMLKQNEKLKNELDQAKIVQRDFKSYNEEQVLEKEKQKTELDKFTEMYDELKVSYEELQQMKEKQQTELEKVTKMYNELKVSHEELQHVKEKQKTELDTVKIMHKELKLFYEERLQLKETMKKESADIKEQLELSKKSDEKLKQKIMLQQSQIDILLIGKTGNGKSKTGNTILGRKVFESKSVTKEVQYEFGEHKSRTIKVVYVPGVGDTRLNNKKAVELTMNAMQYAITANPKGYHAFLLVVKFGGRFTAEDIDTLYFLKNIFGEDYIKNLCILVMTYGDTFEHEREEGGRVISFQDWCKEQKGVFQDLLTECSNRIILFNNRVKDEHEKTKQLDELFQMVDDLKYHGHRYTDDTFNKAALARERLMIEAKKPMINEETMRETSLVIHKLQIIQNTVEPEDRIAPLDELLGRVMCLYDKISMLDKGTGALHDLAKTVESLQKTISDESEFSQRITQERKKMRQREEERKKMFEEELKKQKEAYEKRLKDEKLEEQRRREVQREQEKQREDMEKLFRVEKEMREREYQEAIQKVLKRQKERADELEQKYLEAKEKNDEGFFTKVVNVVSWPFKNVLGYE